MEGSAHLHCGYASRTGAHEGIEYNVAGVGSDLENVLQHLERLLVGCLGSFNRSLPMQIGVSMKLCISF